MHNLCRRVTKESIVRGLLCKICLKSSTPPSLIMMTITMMMVVMIKLGGKGRGSLKITRFQQHLEHTRFYWSTTSWSSKRSTLKRHWKAVTVESVRTFAAGIPDTSAPQKLDKLSQLASLLSLCMLANIARILVIWWWLGKWWWWWWWWRWWRWWWWWWWRWWWWWHLASLFLVLCWPFWPNRCR